MKLKDYSTAKDTICKCGNTEFEEIEKDCLWKCTNCGLRYAYMMNGQSLTTEEKIKE